MKIVATQNEEAWLEDYVREVIAEEPPALPPFKQQIGNAVATWFECEPGKAHIAASGGTIDDRAVAQLVLREQLRGHGFKRASYTLRWDHADTKLMKESAWPDIEAKAKRLIQSGKVKILRNSANTIVGHVEGDHGNYQTEISRDDPNSQAISLWDCECPWDQFAWQRTRQWKKYEGRVCAHVLATYWQAQTMPLDEEIEPGPSPGTPNPSAPGGSAPPGSPPMGGPFQPNMGPGQIAPGSMAPQPPGQAVEPAEIIPQFPNDPAMQPAVNPVSVPGLKPQTPLNPVQNAGGTFSSVQADILARVSAETFVNGEMVSNNEEEFGKWEGLGGGGTAAVPKNSVGEVLGIDPLGLVQVYYAGPAAQNGPLEPHGVTCWHWPSDIRKRPAVRPPGPAIQKRH